MIAIDGVAAQSNQICKFSNSKTNQINGKLRQIDTNISTPWTHHSYSVSYSWDQISNRIGNNKMFMTSTFMFIFSLAWDLITQRKPYYKMFLQQKIYLQR